MPKKNLTATKVRYRVYNRFQCLQSRHAKKSDAIRAAKKLFMPTIEDTMASFGSANVWLINDGLQIVMSSRTR